MDDDRVCTICGERDASAMIGTSLGDLICSGCWREELAAAALPSPPAPMVDRHLARVEAEAANG